MCGGEGTYRCIDCFSRPLLCGACCCKQHLFTPFHRIDKWVGEYFDDSSLHLVSASWWRKRTLSLYPQIGLGIHLGHGGAPCPSGMNNMQHEDGGRAEESIFAEEQIDGVDVDEIPPHLRIPYGAAYITIVDVSGVHFRRIHYCVCDGSKPFHMQLLHANLFPSTMESPRTAFTFAVLDDFIRDNLECGTSAHNYYQKLRRITSNAYPHLVVV